MLADDEVVRAAAASLYHKHPAVSSLHAVRPQHRVLQVKGQAAPLSERSSLVLVGHGAREPSGEMRISGYSYQDVARIIQSSSRIGQKIQTTAVVACGAGSDRRFPQALLQTLHQAGLETELHLWETAVQVAETGDVLSQDGARWRSGDHSKKLVLTVGRTGEIRRRDDRRRCTGQEVDSTDRGILGKGGKDGGKQKDKKRGGDKEGGSEEHIPIYWPDNPERFINPDIYNLIDQNKAEELKKTFTVLESMTWGFFHPEPPEQLEPQKLCGTDSVIIIGKPTTENINNQKVTTGINFEENNNKKANILKKCFTIKTGSDIRNIICHFAKDGENEITHLMVNNWIYEVDPKTLYVYPVGKKLDNNQGDHDSIKESIEVQMGKESYTDIRKGITVDSNNIIQKKLGNTCVYNFRNIFLGKPMSNMQSEKQEAWCTTYFTASVIAESARNFRTFPLTLMALSTVETDKDFWLKDGYITMADGGTWLNNPQRGFSGAAGGDLEKLKGLLVREYRTINKWQDGGPDVTAQFTKMAEIALEFNVLNSDEKGKFITDCQTFFDAVKNQQNLPSASMSREKVQHSA